MLCPLSCLLDIEKRIMIIMMIMITERITFLAIYVQLYNTSAGSNHEISSLGNYIILYNYEKSD